MTNIRVSIMGNPRAGVTFPWGSIRKGGSKLFDLTEKQFSILQANDAQQNPLDPNFTYEVLSDKAPVAVTVPIVAEVVKAQALEDLSDDALKALYTAKIGDPGSKKRKKLIKELRDGGYN